MPLALTSDAKTDLSLSLLATGRKLLSTALASMIAMCLLAMSGCVALSIPSKRFHDPQDNGGLFGDFRRGDSSQVPGQAVDDIHFADDPAHASQCTESCCLGDPRNTISHDEFDDDVDFGSSGHHRKAPEVPWPRYHPVPTRPVFTGYPGI